VAQAHELLLRDIVRRVPEIQLREENARLRNTVIIKTLGKYPP
jgi:hypothetical protein